MLWTAGVQTQTPSGLLAVPYAVALAFPYVFALLFLAVDGVLEPS